ncbi:TetR/AcrR family transcriptional regulator [Mycobacterium sp. Y57]|uniref:TetR/AcrR family transcriptional regulator n=1 Tax=Mycolicibacterium xanthum TaxID=2796469 RepID=UPI001C8500D9|nr:TetR/AcrR family transcriptional regulator [Mycolicibacterium xanthum]MBX7432620.1 TetR/AcrR family transcriptional regulator [Mycolicibacterium xanthum]
MPDRPYHHGDLRAALLSEAGAALRRGGVEGLSLRELARAAGVSHGAPRRHFEDKAALLEALVADGLRRLGAVLQDAATPDGRPFGTVLQDLAVAYVRFATENPALVDLMSASRYLADASDELAAARDESFAPVRRLAERGQAAGDLARGDARRVGTLMFATLHGLATMANNGMIDPLDDDLIRGAADSLVTGLAPTAGGPY